MSPLDRRALLHRMVWSDNQTVVGERERYLRPLGLIGEQNHLQGRRRILRRLRKRDDQHLDHLLALTMLAHGEDISTRRTLRD